MAVNRLPHRTSTTRSFSTNCVPRWGRGCGGVAVVAALVATGTAVKVPVPGPCAGQAPGCGQGPGTTARLAGGAWAVISPGPLAARTGQAALWTGRELLVWGGSADGGDSPAALGDGAAYAPSSGRWHVLSPSPLPARQDAASAWAGTEAFFWGGDAQVGPGTRYFSDGATYDPASGTWRVVPPSPLGARSGALALWTGAQVVVLGGSSAGGFPVDTSGAVFDPVARRWSKLPPFPATAPGRAVSVSATWTGAQLLVWTTYQVTKPVGLNGYHIFPRVVGTSWAPGQRSWQRLPAPSGDIYVADARAYWTGREAVFVGGQYCLPDMRCIISAAPAAVYAPATRRWALLPLDPIASLPGAVAWTGTSLVVMDNLGSGEETGLGGTGALRPGQTKALSPAGTWVSLPPAPLGVQQATMAWTGHELLVWGSGPGGRDLAEVLVPGRPR